MGHYGYTAEELAAATCRTCGHVADCWCDPPGETICPDCCRLSEDGHDFVYERNERDHVCNRCGIPRRFTDYEEDPEPH